MIEENDNPPPAETLRDHIMSPATSKTLTEWWAHSRILELEKQVEVYNHMQEVAKANGFDSLGSVMVELKNLR